MAYFSKKSNYKKGTYLQIYESFYDSERRNTAHHSYKALGYVQNLQTKGIEDPIAYYKDVVTKMNQECSLKKRMSRNRIRFLMLLQKNSSAIFL